MVYYGALSKGCQRCRQRKVKCDQRKPRCARCEKAKLDCPGFRDLGDVMFRDESQRIIRKVSNSTAPSRFTTPRGCVARAGAPLDELAANFFFRKYYTCGGPPFSVGTDSTWLADTYHRQPPGHALRTIIQAAGMAGLANVSHAPRAASESRRLYGRALAALKQGLGDPVESVADTTLMTVLLFGFYEFITTDNWDCSPGWTAHINGAAALVQARGRKQFNNPRASQLFSQVCGQVLYACFQHDVPAPRSVEETCKQLARMGNASNNRPSPMRNICFRFLHFRAAMKSGQLSDPDAIAKTARQLDHDLEAWLTTLPPNCTYNTVQGDDDGPGVYDRRQRHIYRDLFDAQAWNNWRAMRILVNQIMLQHGNCPEDAKNDAALLVHALSTDICVSVASFAESTRIVTLIWPLSAVARCPFNPTCMRRWAVGQLRRIRSSMGFRQAELLADSISQTFSASPQE